MDIKDYKNEYEEIYKVPWSTDTESIERYLQGEIQFLQAELNKIKNFGERSEPPHPLLSDVIDLINKSNDMLKDIYCNVDLPKSLYTKDNDIRDRIDANTVILNKCKEYLRQ